MEVRTAACASLFGGGKPISDDAEPFPTSTTLVFYDANGNMIRDDYKALNISYNQLNMVDDLDFDNNNRIRYIYTPQRQKLRAYVEYASGDWYYDDYCGAFVHRTECDAWYGGSYLKYIATPEGRLVNNGDDSNPSFSWEYAQ